MNTTSQGQAGEQKAASYLIDKGYLILARNYRGNGGEIDIVACLRKTLVFVEVKTRAYHAYGGPLAAVTPSKQRKIAQAAHQYIKANGLKFDSIRFDVICVLPEKTEHIQNAFSPLRTTL